jgi:CheY-like chemotaxis protein
MRRLRQEPMQKHHKILLVDDDPALLEIYQELLAQLPSRPEIVTVPSGPRAMAMLEVEHFRLLICDLKMPKMDGLQVLSIVRRKYPELRTVALTSVLDEQFRSRVYALGVDLFWHKPTSEQETRMFLECLESLLGQETDTGFRGLQSKSLVDIIQLECISQSSSVLRITNGSFTGRICILDGEITDAEAGDLRGEPAFQKILSWRTGSFETLPAEPNRPRTITKSYNGLLLETAQALDEQHAAATAEHGPSSPATPLAQVSQIEGVEFVLLLKEGGPDAKPEARGLENPERAAAWTRQTLEGFRSLGDRLRAGPLEQIEGLGPQRHVALAHQGDTEFCVGWKLALTAAQIRETMKKVLALWAS